VRCGGGFDEGSVSSLVEIHTAAQRSDTKGAENLKLSKEKKFVKGSTAGDKTHFRRC